jgi:undecaprenyl-diphosphatase
MLAIAGLLRFLRTHSTGVFVVYRVLVGSILLLLLGVGVLRPSSGAEPERAAASARQQRVAN